IFSMTFVPAALAIFVKGKVKHGENRIMRVARRAYEPLLHMSLNKPLLIITIGFSLFIGSVYQISRMGTEFLPQLDEGDIALHALRIPGTGMQQSVDMQLQLESVITDF